ncbi:MAG TPA: HAD-IC family P-type ATPase [Thermoleophilia bacterium]|nr:HAD-IC family P-type ATPase [Thermoleophilia bacterium]
MQLLDDQHWHALPDGEIVDLLETDAAEGLDRFAVEHRRAQFGLNQLTPPKGPGPLRRFALQFTDPLVLILLVSAIVTIFLDEWVDAIVIFGVVLLNAIVGYLQEAKAVAAIDALSRAMTAEATLLRAGEQLRLPATEIVPGDLVLVQAGDKVPADLRLLRTRDLRVDESALTGESVPVEKDHSVVPRDTVLAERVDMAYASTLVTYGTGAGLVVGTGDRTEVGRISQLIQSAHDLKTPLTRKIDQFSKVLLVVIVVLAALTFAIGLVRGEDLVEMFRASIALAVAAIPEGLPAAVTVTLAIGVNRMAKRRAIIRKLPAVETLGSTMVICTDKTGTLTQNEMTVQRIVAAGEESRVSGVGYGPEGDIVPGPSAAAREVLLAGLLCNDTALNLTDGRYEVAGDPTEAALLTSAAKAGLVAAGEATAMPRLDAIPFESAYQYMATLHDAGERRRVVYVKGAVERVLERCSAAVDGAGRPAPLDAAAVHAQVDALAAGGLRVLAFARGTPPDGTDEIGHDDVAGGLTFLGLQAMMDPPRPAAIAAVEACHHAGISVKMITGDHAATAAAIAHEIGIVGAADGALTGSEMAAVHDDEFIELADRTNVFARVTPEQKLRLVEALQSKGKVVAMTGDGVNDAPALKQADIGVAMGITGTDVAKDAADMVLTDDDFASIEAAVEEGRGVFDNLVKFIAYALPTNVGQGLVILAGVLLGTALPIEPLQILWINMITAVLLGLGLAFEPKEPGIMDRHPRAPGAPIVSRGVLIRIVVSGLILLVSAFAVFEWALANDLGEEAARTSAVNVFMSVQIFYLFACRSLRRSLFTYNPFGNRIILLGVAVVAGLQVLFTYAPFMNTAFDTTAISGTEWLVILGIGVAVMVFMDLVGVLLRRLHID